MSEYTVISAWNGSGTALVFTSVDARDELLDLYEEFRREYSLPWINHKDAVKGEDVLEMWKLGYRLFNVLISQEGVPRHAKVVPLHHISSHPVAERYSDGNVRLLQVWAQDKEAAVQYAADMLAKENAPAEGLLADVDFGCSNYEPIDTSEIVVPYIGPRRAVGSTNDVLKKATKKAVQNNAPPVIIPGFGQVIDLGNV